MKMKKLLAMVLCVAMVLSTTSLVAFADSTGAVHNVSNNTELAAALNSAVDGDTIKLAAGNYTGGISVGKNITIEGSVDANGVPTSIFNGGNPAIYVSKGTFKNIKIENAFKGVYGEPCGTATFENIHMTGVTYGFHLVAYSNDPVWTIKNCYVDASWANSFGVSGCEGATIIIKDNEFVSTAPYYPESGSPLVNTFSPKTTIEDNAFGENAKILIRDSAKSGAKIGTNYYEDGFNNALHEACAEDVKIENFYADKEKRVKVDAPTCVANNAYTSNNGIWGETNCNAKESFTIKVYSNDTLIGTTSLNNIGGIIDGSVWVTWGIYTDGTVDEYWTQTWEPGHPRLNYLPTKVVYNVDGYDVAESPVQFNGPDNLWPVEWGNVSNVYAAASVDGVKYATLEDAITAIENGATSSKEIVFLADQAFSNRAAGIETNAEDVIFNLNGKTLTLGGDHVYTTDVTFKNGTIEITDEKANTGVFWMWNHDNTLTFEDVVIKNAGESINACGIFTAAADSYGVTPTPSTGDFVFDNVVIDLKNNTFNPDAGANLFYFQDNTSKVTYNSGSITVDSFARGLQYGTYDVDNAVIKMSNMNGNGMRRANGTFTNTVFDVKGSENGIKQDSENSVVFDGNSSVTLTGAKNYDFVLNATSKLTLEDAAMFEAGTSNIAEGATVIAPEGAFINKANTVYVQYKKADVDVNGKDNLEGSDKYEIVLVADAEKINELASADLTFDFNGTPVTGGAMDYFVEPANGVSLTQLGDRYMFNYNGVDKYEETGAAIVIGTITIDGYGSYNLGTKEVTTNAVYATEIRDNIVDGFTPAAGLVINTELFDDDNMVGNITSGLIAVPTRTLKVNVAFPNAVKDNAAAYQDMKVEITGNINGVNKTVKYELGTDAYKMVDGSYVIENNDLVLYNAYTVTVSGAGYRTTRYTVTMTDSKELKFWNNVMDEEQVVEIGKDTSAVKVTYLAGDIVKDNKINIYDLSAVVSYFGTQTVENGNILEARYAKYDLNRDGVIDSKDVAYVLVSWNN